MADIKASKKNKPSLLTLERRRLRAMQIVFALFCVILILSMVLSMVLNP